MPYDLFISYSRRDVQGRVTELVERIKSDFAAFAHRDLVPFFDKQEIQGMQDCMKCGRVCASHACCSPAFRLPNQIWGSPSSWYASAGMPP
jgi:hypothetical protein